VVFATAGVAAKTRSGGGGAGVAREVADALLGSASQGRGVAWDALGKLRDLDTASQLEVVMLLADAMLVDDGRIRWLIKHNAEILRDALEAGVGSNVRAALLSLTALAELRGYLGGLRKDGDRLTGAERDVAAALMVAISNAVEGAREEIARAVEDCR